MCALLVAVHSLLYDSSHFISSHPSSAPQARYVQAKLSVHDRSLKVATVIESLEMEMELLCLTGVEDQLQADVRPTLEILRNAGIKVTVATHLFRPALNRKDSNACESF